MAIAQQVTAREIGQRLLDLLRAESSLRGLWVRAVRDYYELWVLTEPLDPEAEHCYYIQGAELHRIFPDTYIRLHVVHPEQFDAGVTLIGGVIPSDAEPMDSRA